MSTFLPKLRRAAWLACTSILRTESHEYMRLLYPRSGEGQPFDSTNNVKKVVALVQLPEDYFRPHSDCHFFAELAWKKDGIVMVEAEKFALCMNIRKLKEWLLLPEDNRYPFYCGGIRGQCTCRCNGLLHAMWTDSIFRKFFQDQGIVEVTPDYVDYFDDYLPMTEGRDFMAYRNGLLMARDEIKHYRRKLISGEETISRSTRSINVLSAMLLEKILEKLDIALQCGGLL